MSTHTYDPERRTILRAGAWLVLAIAGCEKKEAAPATPEPPPKAPAPGPQGFVGTAYAANTGGRGAASGKMSQAQARYQNWPKGELSRAT